MANLDTQVSLYSMNQQVMAKKEPLDEDTLTAELHGISLWMQGNDSRYFMLLCHEKRDYTIFNLKSVKNFLAIYPEIKETLTNRGDLLAIDMEQDNNAFAIWIRNEASENSLYYLFPYDLGVIEI